MLTWAVKQIGSAHASAYINLLPMSSAGVAWLVLGERWMMTQWIAIMVIGGVWLVRRGEDNSRMS
jgi:drug/metabolite transporter (DMT)-like permease